MLLNSRTTRLIIEAAEAAGIPRASLLGPLGLNESDVLDPNAKVEWRTVVLLVEQLASVVDGDVARLREVGSRMMSAPSHAPLRRLAGAVVSPRRLYDMRATTFARCSTDSPTSSSCLRTATCSGQIGRS